MYLNAMDSIPCYLLRIKIPVKETQVKTPSKQNNVQRLR